MGAAPTERLSFWFHRRTNVRVAKLHSDPVDLFWSKVRKSDGCWLWLAGVDKDGYGKFQITLPRTGLPTGVPSKQRHVRAHAFSYELHHGPVPEGNVVMHTCDTPGCVRPDHLLSGTQQDNRADCVNKGRVASGTKTNVAKLSEAQAVEIRIRGCAGESVKKLAKEFGVGLSAAYDIIAGRSWKHTLPHEHLNA